jgi:UDP-N-acetylmuramyl pentapeptide phosphotransferase/UDP-N-acetylglucosamine-1-phosphate transferase
MTGLEYRYDALAVLVAAIMSALLIRVLRPLLQRYALARPNARSSHQIPTPQGAGIAVVAATMAVAGTIIYQVAGSELQETVRLFCAAAMLAMVGFADDLRPIPVLPRLALQAIAIGLALPAGDFQIVAALPFWLERGLLLLAALWFVNLVNFMDGLDWMTVAEVVPITAAIVVVGPFQHAVSPALIAAALCGAMIGFAPFNRPVAKVFLGDVGSLPIGLLLGWCLLQIAGQHHLAAALLLPLYYLADATVTLLRRMMRGEPFWVAHRSHFYQRATDNGFTVLQVVSEVFSLNLFLAALAMISIALQSRAADAAFLALGLVAVAFVMVRFSRARNARPMDAKL